MSRAARAAFVLLALAGVAEAICASISGAAPRSTRSCSIARLRELPPPAPGVGFVVIVECPDKRTVQLHVEPLPDDGPLARTLDSRRGPRRFAAQAARARGRGALSGRDDGEAAALARADRVARDAARWRRADVDDGRATGRRGGGLGCASRDQAAARRRARAHGDPRRRCDAARIRRDEHRGGRAGRGAQLVATPTAAVVVFPSTPRPLAGIGGELALPWLRLGVRGAIGDTDATLGTIRPWLLTATVARALWCAGHCTSGCVLVRVEGGVAGASAVASSAAAIAHDATAAFGQATLAGELAHDFGDWSVVGSAEAGWAQGLIARVDGANRVDLAGAVGSARSEFAGEGDRGHRVAARRHRVHRG